MKIQALKPNLYKSSSGLWACEGFGISHDIGLPAGNPSRVFIHSSMSPYWSEEKNGQYAGFSYQIYIDQRLD